MTLFEVADPSLEEIFIEHVGRSAVDESEQHLATLEPGGILMRDLFPNALHVARREYLTRVRGRAFVITTILIAVAVVAITLVPIFLDAIGVDDPPEIAVSVQADDLGTDPVTAIQAALIVGAGPAPGRGQTARRRRTSRGSIRVDDADDAAQAVRDGEYDALLTVTRNEEGDLAFEYLGSASPTNSTRLLVTQAATALAVSDRLERAGVEPAESVELFQPPDFTAVAVDPDDSRNEEDFAGSYILAYAVVILTFMAILTYGNWVAQSVAEEKSGRVMELLITAATPRQLLTGKVLGTGAAGLTQYVAIVAAAIIGFVLSGPISEALGLSGQGPFQLPGPRRDHDPLVRRVLPARVPPVLDALRRGRIDGEPRSRTCSRRRVRSSSWPSAATSPPSPASNDPDAPWVDRPVTRPVLQPVPACRRGCC